MIRNATVNDISRIAEISVYSWRYAYKDIVSEEVLYKETLVEGIMQKIKKWIEDIYIYKINE